MITLSYREVLSKSVIGSYALLGSMADNLLICLALLGVLNTEKGGNSREWRKIADKIFNLIYAYSWYGICNNAYSMPGYMA